MTFSLDEKEKRLKLQLREAQIKLKTLQLERAKLLLASISKISSPNKPIIDMTPEEFDQFLNDLASKLSLSKLVQKFNSQRIL